MSGEIGSQQYKLDMHVLYNDPKCTGPVLAMVGALCMLLNVSYACGYNNVCLINVTVNMVLADNFVQPTISDTRTFCIGVRNWRCLKLPASTITHTFFNHYCQSQSLTFLLLAAANSWSTL